jgi:hypothetical protein
MGAIMLTRTKLLESLDICLETYFNIMIRCPYFPAEASIYSPEVSFFTVEISRALERAVLFWMSTPNERSYHNQPDKSYLL